MTEQLDNLVGSISQNELGRIELMVCRKFLSQGQSTSFGIKKHRLEGFRTRCQGGRRRSPRVFVRGKLHIFRLEAMLSGDLLDGLAWLVHRLFQYARVRKLG